MQREREGVRADCRTMGEVNALAFMSYFTYLVANVLGQGQSLDATLLG